MTSTNDWLQDQDHAHLALVLVFEGCDLAYTTTDDTSGIATAYAATDWTNFNPGLYLTGTITQEIKLFDPQLDVGGMTFRILDTDGDFATTVLYNDGSGYKTRLTSTVGAGSTSALAVKSTTGFSSSGTVYVGHEAISYTSTTGTTFAGTITRGKWNLHTTNGGSAWAPRHEVGTIDSTPFAPSVTSVPTIWYNRRVRLYVHHWENGAWSTKANAKAIWEGRLKDWTDNGDGTFDVQCAGIKEELFTSIFRTRWEARVKPGLRVHSGNDAIRIFADPWTGSSYAIDENLTTGDHVTWSDLVNNISEHFSDNKIAGTISSTHIWSIGTVEGEDSPRVQIRVQKSSGSWSTMHYFALHVAPEVARMLGFVVPKKGDPINRYNGYAEPERYDKAADQRMVTIELMPTTAGNEFAATAPGPPLIGNAITFGGGHFRIHYQDEEGSWTSQSYIDPDHKGNGTDGIVQSGDMICSVKNVPGDDYLEVHRFIKLGKAGVDVTPSETISDDGNPVVSQIWLERDYAGQLLLRLLLSTGNSAYNHATYDVLPANVGAGLPSSMFDINSFQDLDVPHELYLRDSASLRDIVEGALAVSGRHLVYKDGKLSVTPPGFEVGSDPSVETLSEDDKARPDDLAVVEYSSAGMINRVTLTSDASQVYRDGPALKLTVQSPTAITDYGQQKGVEIKTRGATDTSHFLNYIATPALAYFSRPLAVMRRTINHTKMHLVPGDIVAVSDDRVVDPHSGARGISGLAAWVRSVSFDFEDGSGEVELAFLPDHPVSRMGRWCPAALATSIDGTSTVLTCEAHEFSHASDSADAAGFVAGDKVRIIERSATGTPTEWAREVQSQTGNTITLTSAISSPAWDSTKRYYVIYDDKSTVASGQRSAYAYLSNSSDTTGYAANDASLWCANYKAGQTPASWTVPFFDAGTALFVRPRAELWAQGEPLSRSVMFDLARNIHNINNYKTRQTLVNQVRQSAATHNATTRKLVWGPTLIPLNGIDRFMSGNALDGYTRKLFAEFRLKTSNASHAATLYLVTTDQMPRGTTTGLVFGGRYREYSVSSTSTSYEWKTLAGTIDPVVMQGTGQAFTWITLELANASTSTSSWDSFCLHEGVLSYS